MRIVRRWHQCAVQGLTRFRHVQATSSRLSPFQCRQSLLEGKAVVTGKRFMTSSPKKKALKRKKAVYKQTDAIKSNFTVALVGRPNVGKSSLFNRLARKQIAITHNHPGTTRDVKEAEGRLASLSFKMLDTGGLEHHGAEDSIEARMLRHTINAIRDADVVLFVVSAKDGICAEDEHVVKWLRSVGRDKNIALIANKAEGFIGRNFIDDEWLNFEADSFRLGLDTPIPISAEHGDGLNNLFDVLLPYSQLAATKSAVRKDSNVAPATSMNTRNADENPHIKSNEDMDNESITNTGFNRFLEQKRYAEHIQTAMQQDNPDSDQIYTKYQTIATNSDTEHIDDGYEVRYEMNSNGELIIERINTQEDGLVIDAEEILRDRLGTDEREEINGFGSIGSDGAIYDERGVMIVGPPRPSAAGYKRERLQKMKLAKPISVAFVGRPNAGKSTLLNQLIQNERVLTGPEAGLTRDTTSVEWTWNNQKFTLVDTAGMRRVGAFDTTMPIEGKAVGQAKRALALSHITVLVVDAPQILQNIGVTLGDDVASSEKYKEKDGGVGPEPIQEKIFSLPSNITSVLARHDTQMASSIAKEGRALVVAMNKADRLTSSQKKQVKRIVEGELDRAVPEAKGIPVIALSALDGKGTRSLMPAIIEAFDKWNLRVPTGYLNRWLRRLSRHHPPPAHYKQAPTKGNRRPRTVELKLKFFTQINVRPPTFVVFANRSDIPESYMRFLKNSLREEFHLQGIPLRLMARAASNPYTHR